MLVFSDSLSSLFFFFAIFNSELVPFFPFHPLFSSLGIRHLYDRHPRLALRPTWATIPRLDRPIDHSTGIKWPTVFILLLAIGRLRRRVAGSHVFRCSFRWSTRPPEKPDRRVPHRDSAGYSECTSAAIDATNVNLLPPPPPPLLCLLGGKKHKHT